ncbi:MAG TPA: protein kinase [Plantibacter sp.]|uniref:protein kinase domain-containing protein n=1 Tax=Plantibacter sp. TaxID=1871045 RepID=UPI002BFFDCB0|nr:protein kinase [Plantibacter sp.]
MEQFRDHPNVVTLHSTFEQSGHLFLVEEYVDGRTLNAELVQRNRLIRADETPTDRMEYRDWALSLMVEIEGALRSFHAAGIVFGDLHPNNILITPAGRPVFIDFEMSYGVDDQNITPAGAPGFVANDGRIGVAADLYALGCTMLSVFLPLTVLIPLDSLKLQHLVHRARDMFDLPEDYCRAILQFVGSTRDSPGSIVAATTRSVIEKWSIDSFSGIDEILELIEDGIRESSTLWRKDRAFPGDPRQFTENAVGIAHGACGNLLTTSLDERSLRKTLDWIEDSVAALTQPAFGFYDGIAGIAHTLRHFGRHDAADALVTRLTGIDFSLLPSELYGGLAGIGIFFMDEATRRPTSGLDAAIETIRALLSTRLDQGVTYLTEVDGVRSAATGKAGLMHGATGHALFWICSFERDHDPTDLVRARTALNIDLSACTLVNDGSLQLNEGWRTLPYIGTGSMGVGLVLLRLTGYAPEPHDADTLRSILRCATPAFAIQSNLLNGRAGFLYFVTTILQSPFAHLVDVGEARRHAQELGTFAVLRGTGIHFPGEQIIRLSTDWATGSAGVYAALKRYRDVAFPHPETSPAALPFIGLDRQLLTAREEEKK